MLHINTHMLNYLIVSAALLKKLHCMSTVEISIILLRIKHTESEILTILCIKKHGSGRLKMWRKFVI